MPDDQKPLVQQALNDPEFYQHDDATRMEILSKLDPEFAALDDAGRRKVIGFGLSQMDRAALPKLAPPKPGETRERTVKGNIQIQAEEPGDISQFLRPEPVRGNPQILAEDPSLQGPQITLRKQTPTGSKPLIPPGGRIVAGPRDLNERAGDFIDEFVQRNILGPKPGERQLPSQWMGESRLPYSQLLPDEQRDENPLLTGGRAMLQASEGLFAPEALLTMGGAGALPALGRVGRAAQVGLGAYFTATSAKGAGEAMTAGYDALQQGDMHEAARQWGFGTADAIFATLLARANAREAAGAAKEIGQAWREWREANKVHEPEVLPADPKGYLGPASEPPTIDVLAERGPLPGLPAADPNTTRQGAIADLGRAEGAEPPPNPPSIQEHLEWIDRTINAIEDGFRQQPQTNAEPAAPRGNRGRTGEPPPPTGLQPETGTPPTPPEPGTSGTGAPSLGEGPVWRIPDIRRPFQSLEEATTAAEHIATRTGQPVRIYEWQGDKAKEIVVSPKEVAEPEPSSTDSTVEVKPEPQPEPEPEPAPALQAPGPSDEIETARGTKARVRSRIIESDDLIRSHTSGGEPNPVYPQAVQPRDRGRVASRVQIDEIKGKLAPEKLGQDVNADRGAPVVVGAGVFDPKLKGKYVVVSGNGRSIALDELYGEEHANATKYRTWAESQSDQARNTRKPIVVRELLDAKPTDDYRQWVANFAREANEDDKGSMAASEVARADAKRFSPALMDVFRPSEDGDIMAPSNRDFQERFFREIVSSGERGALQDRSGSPSQQGIQRMRNAVFAYAFGSEGGALEKMAEAADSNIRNITTGMLHAAPAWSRMRYKIDGKVLHDADLTPDLNAAVEVLNTLRENGGKVADYLAQISMFGDDLSQEGKAMLAALDNLKRSPRKIGNLLREITLTLEAAGNPSQGGLFGDAGPAPTKREILEAAIQAANKGDDGQGTLFQSNAEEPKPSQGPVQGSPTLEVPQRHEPPRSPTPAQGDGPPQGGGKPQGQSQRPQGKVAQPPADPDADIVDAATKALEDLLGLQPQAPPVKPEQPQANPQKPLWMLHPIELDVLLEAAKRRDKSDLVDLFGEDGAARYAAAERKANSSDPTKSRSGQAVLDEMQAGLSKQQQDRLFGVGDTRPQVEELKEYRQALSLAWDSPKDLGRSLRWAISKIGDESDPEQMTKEERLAYAALRFGFEGAERAGWNVNEVAREAAIAAAERFSDPDDALFVLRRFVKGLQPQASPQPEPEKRGENQTSEAEVSPQKTAFTTEQGSRYQFEDGKTVRTKALHKLHDPADVGLKPRSDVTLFVSPEAAREIGLWNTSSASGKRVVVRQDLVLLTSINPNTGSRGQDGKFPVLARGPVVGLHPLELWEPSSSVRGGWRNNHPGSRIVAIESSTDSSASPTLTPEETAFINAMVERIGQGDSTNQVQLAKIANDAFKGTAASGAWNIQQAYELVEVAVNQFVKQKLYARFGISFTESESLTANAAMYRERIANEMAELLDFITELLPRQSARSDNKLAYQQFSTPPSIAFLASVAAAPKLNDVVLEPSAGTGNLVAWVHQGEILTNEIDPHRQAALRSQGYDPTGYDAEQINNLWPADKPRPSLVVMNPPFSAAGHRGITKDQSVWTRHVKQALLLLRDGGRLVAVLPGGRTGAWQEGAAMDGSAREWWNGIQGEYNVRANILLPGKWYSKYGTTYPTRLVVIDKTGPTAAPTTILQTEPQSLQEALDALYPIAKDRPAAAPESPRGDSRGHLRNDGGEAPRGAASGIDRSSRSGRSGGGVGRTPASGGSGTGSRTPGVGGRKPNPAPGRDRKPAPSPSGQGSNQPGNSGSSPVGVPPSLQAAADAARKRLEEKLKGSQNKFALRPDDAAPDPDRQTLIDLATMGALNIVQGATAYKDWRRKFMGESGELLRLAAASMDKTPAELLLQVHGLASKVATRFGATAEPTPATDNAPNAVTLGTNEAAFRQSDVGGGVFTQYLPAKLMGGAPHPAAIVQSAALAATEPPDITYMPAFDPAIIEEGRVSNVQLEAICYAGQRFEKILPTGQRAGIFIGDGTGVGKGREVSGIAADHFANGRKRVAWISVSQDLFEDAKRDLDDLGVTAPLRRFNDWRASEPINVDSAVVFSTYNTLIQETKPKNENELPVRRLDQLMEWLGNDGLLILDEAHKAKNAGTGEEDEGGAEGDESASQRALAVIEIQNKLPLLRVVYASATGATEPRNMAYMSRLGIWGTGTGFADFSGFLTEVENGGVGAMEMVARDLKARGAYLSRTISYEGVEYREETHQLTDHQKHVFDTSARAWQVVIAAMLKWIEKTKAPGRARGHAMSLFWGAHQRFFKQIITAFKVPTTIKTIESALAENKSIVVSVMSTGEALQKRLLQGLRESGGTLNDIDWSPRQVLDNIIVKAFPIHAHEEVKENGRLVIKPVLDQDGKPVIDKEALAARERLRDQLTDIAVPGNPIDLLIEHFHKKGFPVAELTGRKERIETDAQGNKVLRKRKIEGIAQKYRNLAEMKAFQSGEKRIAIISDAASTGISLHADRRAKNQQRRVHIALELKWSADMQLQDFGRTHRSNQVQPPEYVLMSTAIGGDKRFSSTIARRLASLGALTKGSRDASGAGDIAKYNFETGYGITAVSALITELTRQTEGRETLAQMGYLERDPDTGEAKGDVNAGVFLDVPHFLNRVLGLELGPQNAIFDRFMERFTAAIETAKRYGMFDEGLSDMAGALDVELVQSTPVPGLDPEVKTAYHEISATWPTTRYTVSDAEDWRAQAEQLHPGNAELAGWYMQKASKRIVMVSPVGTVTDPASGRTWREYKLLRPNGNTHRLTPEELAKYERLDDKLAVAGWNAELAKVPETYKDPVHLVSGAILHLWSRIQKSGSTNLRVIRVQVTNGPRVVGLRIPNANIGDVLRAIGVTRSLLTPEDIWRGVVVEGEEIRLANDLYLRRSRLRGEVVFEIANAKLVEIGMLRQIDGLVTERHEAKLRIFIPTEKEIGFPVLEKVLELFPVIASTTGQESGSSQYARKASSSQQRSLFGETTLSLPTEPEAGPRLTGRQESLFSAADQQQMMNDVMRDRIGQRQAALDAQAKSGLKLTGGDAPPMQAGMFGEDEGPKTLFARDRRRVEDSWKPGDDPFYARKAGANLFVSPVVMALANEVLETQFSGANLGHRASRLIETALQDLNSDAASRVADLMAEIRYQHKTVNLIPIGPDISRDQSLSLLRHEEFHRTVGKIVLPLSFYGSALARKAVAALRKLGYGAKEIGEEIGAHLTEGPIGWGLLGLTEEEASQLFREYWDNLPPDTAARIRRYHPKLKEIIRDARRTQAANRTGNLGEDGTPRGSEGRRQLRRGVEPDVSPRASIDARFALREAAQGLLDTRDELRRIFNPVARGESAERAALSMREHAARQAREFAKAEHATDKARALFARMSWEENLDFINRVEAGEDQPTDELQAIADTLRKLLDQFRDDVQNLGSGKLQTWYETYFPHIWKRPEAAADEFKRIFAKRPIEGPKSFLKKRKYQTFAAGIEAGLEPVSQNAIDLVLLKLKEMGRYILAHRFLNEMKAKGLVKYVPILKRKRMAPPGWTELPDPLGGVWGPPWVKIREAVDGEMWNALTAFAERLGIDHRRLATMKGGSFGYAQGMDKIRTRFGGPESALIHEIGHILDNRYGLADQLVKTQPFKKELQDLADLRLLGDEPPSYKNYVHKKSEKMANMVAAYVHNRRLFERTAPQTYRWFSAFIKTHPELGALERIEYGMTLLSWKMKYPVGGLILRGHYFMPEAAAQLVKNYLSPGLHRKAWYRPLRGAANSMLQFALGFSGYHAGFTTYEALVGRLGLAFEAGAEGKLGEALLQLAKVPITPVTNVMQGQKILKAYFDDTIDDPELTAMVEAIIGAGGRVTMDEMYRTKFRQRFVDALYRGNVIGAVVPGALAIPEIVSWPIMEWLVPRQKVGAFANMAARILAESPNMSKEERRARLARAWDSIDNRFGQIVYDNLFWERVAKDLAMISVQSLGWNIGTFREIGGGAMDWLKQGYKAGRYVTRKITGGGGSGSGGNGGGNGPGAEGEADPGFDPELAQLKPEMTHRMAYVLALPVLTAFLGAILNYLMTKGTIRSDGTVDDGHPREWKDYFFPRTGGYDDRGTPERITLIGYMKDVFHWFSHPLQAARNKLNPLVRIVAEMLSNEDYYGVQIWNRNDPVLNKLKSVLAHIGKTFVPYAWRNYSQAADRGGSTFDRLAPQIGITPAPRYITTSRAEERMGELVGERRSEAGMDHETAERARSRREVARMMRSRDPKWIEAFRKEVSAGNMTAADLTRTAATAAKDPVMARFQMLGVEDALEVYSLGTDDEKRKWRLLVMRKLASLTQKSPAQTAAIRRRWQPVIEEVLGPRKAAAR